MATHAVTLKCPSCGGDLSVDPDMTDIVCQHCGATLHVRVGETPANEPSPTPAEATPPATTEPEAAPAEPQNAKTALSSRNKKLQAIFFLIWLISTILIIASCVYMLFTLEGTNALIGILLVAVIGGLPIIVGGAYIVFKLIPDTN